MKVLKRLVIFSLLFSFFFYLLFFFSACRYLFLLTRGKKDNLLPLLIKGKILILPGYKTVSFLPSSWRLTNEVIDLSVLTSKVDSGGREIISSLLHNQGISEKKVNRFQRNYLQLSNRLLNFLPEYKVWQWRLGKWIALPKIDKEKEDKILLSQVIVRRLIDILGFKGKQHYYFLVQNNCELRPTGGFMGSLADLEVENGKWNILFFDVYQYDGNLPGHVTPPPPIQQAFKIGFWRLRDANWNPDFPQAAKDINWFLLQSQAPRPDAFIALNYSTIKTFLRLTGPISLPGYDFVLNQNNFYHLLHQLVQENFYPGSQYKPRLITLFGTQLVERLKKLPPAKRRKLLSQLKDELENRQILLYSFDPRLEVVILKLDWGGKLQINRDNTPWQDYLYLVEANLGADKNSCSLQRQVIDNIFLTSKYITHNLTLRYVQKTPRKYRAYLRLILPSAANHFQLNGRSEGYDLGVLKGTQAAEVGFWLSLSPRDKRKEIHLSFRLPITFPLKTYRLFIQRQPGVVYSYKVNVYNSQPRLLFSRSFLVNQDMEVILNYE